MKKIIIITILCVILTFSVSFQDVNRKSEEVERDYIVCNIENRPKDLKMTDNKKIREKDLLNSLFEGLVKVNKDGNIVGGLSKEYKVSDDKIEYQFKIRDNAKYSNGEKIKSKDFVKFFKEFLSDENNLYREELSCIYGVSDYITNKTSFENVAIKDVSDDVLKIRLNKPCDKLLEILSQPVMSLRDYNLLKDFSKCDNSIKYSGPFFLKVNEKDEYVLCKNNNYYNVKEVTDNRILLSFIEDKEEVLANFEDENYKLDIFIDPPINESFKLTEQDRTEGFLGKQSVYINFNLNNKSISNNINFRNAINKSLSKEYFIQKISKDFGVPATSYSIGQENEFDKCSEVSLAKKYLSEVKYEKDSVVKFLYKNNSIERRIADDIAKDIMEDLDISVKLISYEEKDLDKILEGKDFDMMLYIYDNENTKKSYYYLWKSENNKFGFTDLQYDKLINNLESNVESSKKNEVYKECEKLLLNKIPAIPIYNLNTVLCRKNFIENVYINKNGYLVLSELKISNEKQKEKS